jgi:hypothetical protein
LGFFISHWGLPYAQSPNSKAIWQLGMFPRQLLSLLVMLVFHQSLPMSLFRYLIFFVFFSVRCFAFSCTHNSMLTFSILVLMNSVYFLCNFFSINVHIFIYCTSSSALLFQPKFFFRFHSMLYSFLSIGEGKCYGRICHKQCCSWVESIT